jgi:putative oxidoreductase
MNLNPVGAGAAAGRAAWLQTTWNRIADRLEALISPGLLALGARIAMAAIFFSSGRTKVDGFLTVKDST